MPHKTLDQLAAEMPDHAMAVGELEMVEKWLKDLLDASALWTRDELLVEIEDIALRIGGRIEKLDESGEARRWEQEWREAEEAGER
jgi:hypothetical protein